METETIDRLFLELSQFTTATTKKELDLLKAVQKANNICRSMHAIAGREGGDANWPALQVKLNEILDEQHAILHPKK